MGPFALGKCNLLRESTFDMPENLRAAMWCGLSVAPVPETFLPKMGVHPR